MKTWQEIAAERIAFVKEMQDLLARRVSSWQRSLYSKLSEVVASLETDPDGRVLFNSANQYKAREIGSIFRQFGEAVKNGDYGPDGKRKGGLMSWVVSRVEKLIGLNTSYMDRITGTKTPLDVQEAARLSVFSQLGYENGTIVPGSWLDNVAQHGDVKARTMQRMQQSISTGMPLSEFRKSFRADFVDTKTGLGLLSRHYGTHTGNLFASIDRQVSQAIAQQTGMEYFVYSGTIVDNTRGFCETKVGKLFHVSIFNEWNKQDWPGKIKNSDTRITLGGHRCRHAVNYVSAKMAKRMVLAGRDHGLTPAQLNELMKVQD